MVWAQREETGEAAARPGEHVGRCWGRLGRAVRDPTTHPRQPLQGTDRDRCVENHLSSPGVHQERKPAQTGVRPPAAAGGLRRPRHVCPTGGNGSGVGAAPAALPQGMRRPESGHAVERAGTRGRRARAERRWESGWASDRFWPRRGRVGGLDSGRDHVAGSGFMETWSRHAGQQGSEGPAWGSQE